MILSYLHANRITIYNPLHVLNVTGPSALAVNTTKAGLWAWVQSSTYLTHSSPMIGLVRLRLLGWRRNALKQPKNGHAVCALFRTHFYRPSLSHSLRSLKRYDRLHHHFLHFLRPVRHFCEDRNLRIATTVQPLNEKSSPRCQNAPNLRLCSPDTINLIRTRLLARNLAYAGWRSLHWS